MTKALFTGSFDPITLGHIDIIRRAAAVFDEVIVCAMININKNYLFSRDERLALMRESLADVPGVRVDAYEGFAAEYARAQNVDVMVKGVRGFIDYEYEANIAFYNKRIAPDIETICFFADGAHAHISSSGVRELLAFGGSVEGLVPDPVLKAISHKTRRDQS